VVLRALVGSVLVHGVAYLALVGQALCLPF
jgi:hypothetical protein